MHESIVGKAIEDKLLDMKVTNFRDYASNKHNNVDDYPYGGGAGMLLQPQPIFDAMAAVEDENRQLPKGRVIILDPGGKPFNQKMAEDFANETHLTFICGHYEGYDERIKTLATDEVSLGDYVLTGGELAAMVMIDATVRLLPGVLGNEESAPGDSFSTGLLEYPQYSRPADFRGMQVPEVLLSGNHQLIAKWRRKQALKRTLQKRPDLLDKMEFDRKDHELLEEIKLESSDKNND
ncbi:tRNA (guanine-N(1)-)-methyltransferase [Pediococcus damnosus]|nr:tRNA (guanine-N(1)-)-methyltransferase [Pediococcus damnosus]